MSANLTQALAAFFLSRPNEWHDGHALAAKAGFAAWRTRVSELRRPPFSMTIENRQRRVQRPDGSRFTISEYRFSPTTRRSSPPPLFAMHRQVSL